MKALMILDDNEMLNAISLSFQLYWPEVAVITTSQGSRGIEMVEAQSPDVVLLDVILPDIAGFDVLSQIRSFSSVPIIIVTSRGEEIDRVKGLEKGADDYMVKPFSCMELIARVKAILRRANRSYVTRQESVSFRGLVVNLHSGEVTLDGKHMDLTSTEYRLLCHLVRNSGRTVSKQVLMERVWGKKYPEKPDFLKVHIYRLRRKLAEASRNQRLIVTVPGIGYRIGQ